MLIDHLAMSPVLTRNDPLATFRQKLNSRRSYVGRPSMLIEVSGGHYVGAGETILVHRIVCKHDVEVLSTTSARLSLPFRPICGPFIK